MKTRLHLSTSKLCCAAVVIAVGLSACSGSDGAGAATSSPAGTGSASNSGAANGGSAESEPSGAGANGASTAGNQCVSEAQGTVDAAKAPMTVVMPEEPLDGAKLKADLEGRTVWFISAANSSPTLLAAGAGIQAAADTAGVQLQIFDGKGTPTAWSQGILEAVAADAAGIIIGGFDRTAVPEAINDALEAGIPVIDWLNGSPDDPLDGYYAHVTVDWEAAATAMADHALASSDCVVDVLVVHTLAYQSQEEMAATAQGEIARLCPGCTVETIGVRGSDIATQAGPATVAALNRNPDIGYVIATTDTLAGFMAPAVEASHPDVRISAVNGVQQNLEMVAGDGPQVIDVSVPPLGYAGWLAFDQIARANLDMQAPVYALPTQLFEKDNLDLADPFPQFAGYQDMFKKLWGLS